MYTELNWTGNNVLDCLQKTKYRIEGCKGQGLGL